MLFEALGLLQCKGYENAGQACRGWCILNNSANASMHIQLHWSIVCTIGSSRVSEEMSIGLCFAKASGRVSVATDNPHDVPQDSITGLLL